MATTTISQPTCSVLRGVCFRKATDSAQDLIEVEPVLSVNGQRWRCYKKNGPTKFFCSKHARLPIRTMLPTSSTHSSTTGAESKGDA